MAGLPYRCTVVLVDDGSDDETAALLDREVRAGADRKVIHLARSFGHQAALTAGLDEALRLEADAAVCLDSDLQHPPRLIRDFLLQWEAGFEVVYGVREEDPRTGILKRMTSRWFYALIGPAPHPAGGGGGAGSAGPAARDPAADRDLVLGSRGRGPAADEPGEHPAAPHPGRPARHGDRLPGPVRP